MPPAGDKSSTRKSATSAAIKEGTGGSKLDETARNRVWREHCAKEEHCARSSNSYAITNPQHMELLPEKPNKVVPMFVRPESADLRNAANLLASMSNAKSTYKAYGFRPAVSPLPPNPMFTHHLPSSDVTSYAAAYAAATGGASPFGKAARSADPAAKAAGKE